MLVALVTMGAERHLYNLQTMRCMVSVPYKVAASNTNHHISKEKYRVDRTSRVFMNYWQTASRIVVMPTFGIGVETTAFCFSWYTPPAMAARSVRSALRGANPRLTTTHLMNRLRVLLSLGSAGSDISLF